jgi:hypothetical protein
MIGWSEELDKYHRTYLFTVYGKRVFLRIHFLAQLAFQRRRFLKNRPIRNKNCLWRQCLLMDWDELSNLYRGPSIDAPYQVSVHLAEGFQRRRLKYEKLTDDGCQVMAKAHIAIGKKSSNMDS